MTLPTPTYDLVLILDPQVEADTRAKIVAEARTAIEAGGELLRQDDWGERALAYPIERHPNGEYHLLQFHPAGAELLSSLDRTLRITDGILRFRIIKLRPGVPDAPDMRSAAPAAPVARHPEPDGEVAPEVAEHAPAEPSEQASPEVAEQAPAEPSEQPPAEAAEAAAAEIAVGDPA